MSDLTRLKGSERIRKRVSVMMGSDDIKGCQHTLFEIISNSIDRFRKGYGNYIKIIKHKDLSYTIIDKADGLPMDWNIKENAYNWDLALKTLYAGDNYNNDSTALGLNGLGLCSSQYASEYMNVVSYKNDKKYTVKFKKGRPIDKNTKEFICEDDNNLFTKEQGLRVLQIENNLEHKQGTIITYRPDLEVFTDIDISMDWINDKLNKQSMVNKGLKIETYDEINDKLITHYYENGIKDYIEQISDNNNFSNIIYFEDQGEGRDRKDNPVYKYKYEIALVFNNNLNKLEYYHNSSELLEGGSTADAINLSLTNVINEYAKDNNLFNKNESKIKFNDIEDSLICVISSFSTRTSYANQTKLKINNKFIKDFTNESLKEKLKVYLIENKIEADKIVNQILINKRANDKAEKSKINIKKKLQQTVGILNNVPNFIDCVSKDKNKRELYLTEGLSALGSVKLSRNKEFQAILPLRGKILNCLKADYDKIFKNEIIVNLLKTLGCGIEIKSKHNKELNMFNYEKLNYNKIMIATDMDVDGMDIRCLILTLFYRLTPTLIKKGKIFIVDSPLFEITNLKNKQTYFAYNDNEKNQIIKQNQLTKYKVNRSKGLGENSPEMMAQTMMNPLTRKTTQVQFTDVENMTKYFELFMGYEVEPRREYIELNGHKYMDYIDIA